ncbi:MAG: bacteriocin [Cyanobacteria bacterium P01_F01_bin.150]
MTEQNKNNASDEVLSEEQLKNVSGGLSGRIKEEFEEGLGNKGISGRIKEEFEEGLGNKAYSEEDLRDQVGNG